MFEMGTFLSITNKLRYNFLSVIIFRGKPSIVKGMFCGQVL